MDRTILFWIFGLGFFWLVIGLDKFINWNSGILKGLGIPAVYFFVLSGGAFVLGCIYYLYHKKEENKKQSIGNEKHE